MDRLSRTTGQYRPVQLADLTRISICRFWLDRPAVLVNVVQPFWKRLSSSLRLSSFHGAEKNDRRTG